jgi:hypothetical protein
LPRKGAAFFFKKKQQHCEQPAETAKMDK